MNAQASMSTPVKEKLIVALDVETVREARETFAALRGQAGMFKIGPKLFTSAGPDIVREIVAAGERVFLDLKFHDIPNIVAAAAREAARLGVSLFTVHASGGGEMMRRVAEALAEMAAREGIRESARVVGVTVLTSADAATLREIGIAASPEDQATSLARLAARHGLDGVVASPHEIAALRAAVPREDFLIVTPGVRPANVSHDDQKRVMTPAEAVRAGASYIVVGRAILNAPDPARAAAEIIEEMEKAKGGKH